MGWFEDLKEEILAYLDKATEEEIQVALERANYAFYKDIDVPILDFHEMKNYDIHLEDFVISADNYDYALAA